MNAHTFDADPKTRGATCQCGLPALSAVHPDQQYTDVPPLPEPTSCSRCWHDPHVGECGWRKRGFVGVRGAEVIVCRCPGGAS